MLQIIQKDSKNNLEETIRYTLKRINFTRKCIVIDLDKDEIKIREEYQTKIKDSVAELYPELIKDWHPTKTVQQNLLILDQRVIENIGGNVQNVGMNGKQQEIIV